MVKRIGCKHLQEHEIIFMAETVEELCNYVLDKLDEYMKKYSDKNEYEFVSNVMKNFCGNFLLQGCDKKDIKTFNNLVENLIQNIKDFVDTYTLEHAKTTGEMQ